MLYLGKIIDRQIWCRKILYKLSHTVNKLKNVSFMQVTALLKSFAEIQKSHNPMATIMSIKPLFWSQRFICLYKRLKQGSGHMN